MSQNNGMTKRMRFSVPTRAQHTASQIVHDGETEEIIQDVPIDLLEHDPANRPLTKLTLDNPDRIDASDPHYLQKSKFLEGVRNLAQSIRAVGGIKEPLRVFKLGAKYRIIFGERRALAAVLAGLKSVPAIIETGPPEGLRRIQAAENMQREDVLAGERIQSLADLIKEEEKAGRKINGPSDLTEILGVSKAYASMLLALVSAPEDVAEAMRSGALASVRTAYEISKIEDSKNRATALQTVLAGAGREAVVATAKRNKTKPASRRGRKRVTINLGRTENLGFVKRILTAIGKPHHRRGVDWNDPDAVQRTWDQFIKGE